MRCGRSTDGFTLIELLVAFTILGLLVAATFSGLNVGLSSWSRGTAAVEGLRSRDLGLDLIHEQLRSALPFLQDTQGLDSRIAFEAGERRIDFVSTFSVPDGPGVSPRWVTLAWEPNLGGAGDLTISERRILSPGNRPEPTAYWSATVVPFSRVRFRFFERGEANPTGEWRNSWISPEGMLPDAVEIVVDTDGQATRRVLVPLDSARFRRLGAELR